jgi:hypothetical protein
MEVINNLSFAFVIANTFATISLMDIGMYYMNSSPTMLTIKSAVAVGLT